jgi:hypothetical protein
MMASSGCFFAHLSYSLTIASLVSSFFMLAMRTPSGRNICLGQRFYEAKMASWGWAHCLIASGADRRRTMYLSPHKMGVNVCRTGFSTGIETRLGG